MDKLIRINLGCGRRKLPDWINVDIEGADVNCDISKTLPFEDNYADEIMGIHIIEHFYAWQTTDILKEWMRVLKPGGKLVLECPDILKSLNHVMKTGKLDGPMFFWVMWGDPSHKNEHYCHKWGFTPSMLIEAVLSAGFKSAEQKPALFHKKEKRDLRVEAIK